jgi:hypothetical protein
VDEDRSWCAHAPDDTERNQSEHAQVDLERSRHDTTLAKRLWSADCHEIDKSVQEDRQEQPATELSMGIVDAR